ncbi:hypothetical protein VTO73DRAFT_2378 [Trametes versicolor]
MFVGASTSGNGNGDDGKTLDIWCMTARAAAEGMPTTPRKCIKEIDYAMRDFMRGPSPVITPGSQHLPRMRNNEVGTTSRHTQGLVLIIGVDQPKQTIRKAGIVPVLEPRTPNQRQRSGQSDRVELYWPGSFALLFLVAPAMMRCLSPYPSGRVWPIHSRVRIPFGIVWVVDVVVPYNMRTFSNPQDAGIALERAHALMERNHVSVGTCCAIRSLEPRRI